MLGKLFKRLTKSKNPESKRYRYDMAQRICGHHVKYVTERIDNVDEVIGRSGGLNIRGDELLVYASFKVLMRCKIADMEAAELAGIPFIYCSYGFGNPPRYWKKIDSFDQLLNL